MFILLAKSQQKLIQVGLSIEILSGASLLEEWFILSLLESFGLCHLQ